MLYLSVFSPNTGKYRSDKSEYGPFPRSDAYMLPSQILPHFIENAWNEITRYDHLLMVPQN